jgi:NAD(P)-dependent dehydrogenase (short-subunit alcohol dehydrogenase family)
VVLVTKSREDWRKRVQMSVLLELPYGTFLTVKQLALWFHKSKSAEKLAATITNDFGVKVRTYRVAVEDYQAVERGVAEVVNDFGRLDVMIANAGIPTKAGGLDDRVEDWNRVRAVDFDGAYYCARAAGMVFRKQGCEQTLTVDGDDEY